VSRTTFGTKYIAYLDTYGDSDVISFHMYASWFSLQSCGTWVIVLEMFIIVMSLNYALSVGQ